MYCVNSILFAGPSRYERDNIYIEEGKYWFHKNSSDNAHNYLCILLNACLTEFLKSDF